MENYDKNNLCFCYEHTGLKKKGSEAAVLQLNIPG